MRNLLSTVLLLAATLAASAQNDLKSVLSQLDATLSHRDSYIAGREQRIESLKNILRKSDFSDAQRYTLNQQLIDEYTPYQADSTIDYLYRNIALATRMNDAGHLNESRIQLAYLYSSAGIYLEAANMLKLVDTTALDRRQLVDYYIARHKLNDELQLYSHDSVQGTQSWHLTVLYARLIVEKNLYGLDIDKRAYQLAYFAVMMKARQYNRRILNGELRPHLYAIQDSNGINRNQLQFFGWSMGDVERNKALTQVEYLLDTFRDAKEYGSILSVDMLDWELLYRFAGTVDYSDQISLDELNLEATKDALWTLVEQGAVLAQKYDVVVTNPPYMAVSNAGAKVNDYVKKNFPDSKADLFAVFIERCGQMAKKNGYQAMITQHAWMFLSSFEKLRRKLLAVDIVNMAHLGARAFEEIGGEVVQTTSFVMQKANAAGRKGLYARLVDGASQQEKEMIFLERKCQFVTDKENYDVIPGKIIAYWLSDALVNDFRRGTPLGEIAFPRQGLATSNNDKYLRLWFEVANDNLNTKAVSTSDAKKSGKRWYPHCKGGGYRKWYGNRDYVIDWKDDGKLLRNDNKAVIRNPDYYFLDGFSYSDVSTGDYALRYYGNGFIFDSTGPMIFLSGNNHMDYDNAKLLALMNTSVVNKILTFLCPTIHYTQSAVAKIPLFEISTPCETALKNVELSRDDWDAYENSWDFKRNPLV